MKLKLDDLVQINVKHVTKENVFINRNVPEVNNGLVMASVVEYFVDYGGEAKQLLDLLSLHVTFGNKRNITKYGEGFRHISQSTLFPCQVSNYSFCLKLRLLGVYILLYYVILYH